MSRLKEDVDKQKTPDFNAPRIDVAEKSQDLKNKRSHQENIKAEASKNSIRDKKNTDKLAKNTSNLSNTKIKKHKGHSDLFIRLRTGLIYAIVIIGCSLAGNITSLILIAAASGICAYEFFLMLRSDAKLPNEVLGIIGSVMYPVLFYFLGITGVILNTMILLFLLLCWYVFWYKARIADVCISFFGAIYTGGLLTCLLSLRLNIPGNEIFGGIFIIFLLFTISINDGFAYLFGKAFGKHQLAHRISPKKTWEGFVAGLVFSTLAWCLLIPFPGIEINIWQCLLFGFICSIVGVLGDLVESRIKRNSGVKDSGKLLPGHGGLLDRLDSIFLVSLASAALLYGFGCIPFVW